MRSNTDGFAPEFKKVVSATGRTGGTVAAGFETNKPCLVLHSTEGVHASESDMKNYFKDFKFPPHVWAGLSELNSHTYKKGASGSRNRGEKVREGFDAVYQRIPFNKTAYATLAPTIKATKDVDGKIVSGKIQTNRSGLVLQAEIEGYASDSVTWGDDVLEKIGRKVVAPMARWIRDNVDSSFELIPFRDVGSPHRSYGFYKEDKNGNVVAGSQRMSYQDWLNRTGGQYGDWTVCFHQHVAFNKHWDFAANLKRICEFANDELAGGVEAADTHLPLIEIAKTKLAELSSVINQIEIATRTQ